MNFRILYRIIAVIATVVLLIFFPWQKIEANWLYRVVYYSAWFVAFSAFSELFKHIFFHYYRRKKGLKNNQTNNIIEAMNNLHYILLFFAVIITILSFFNLKFINFVTSLSIVAAAIAVVSKDYLANIISGLITVFSKEIEIDDNIQIREHRGKVKEINLSNVVLLNDDDDVVYIPNNIIYSTDFINYSKRKIRKTSIDFVLNTKFLKSADELEAILYETLKEDIKYISEKSINLRIEDIQNDHIAFKYQFTLKQPNREIEKAIRKKVKRQVLNLMANHE